MFALALVAAIYGVISWLVINKFRHLRNYVLLSAIMANALSILFNNLLNLQSEELVRPPLVDIIYSGLLLYLKLSYSSWLLVLCYTFYVDFVKVLSFDIRREYYKSNLLAWGLPFITTLLVYVPMMAVYVYKIITSQTLTYVIVLILLIPVVISFVIYTIVVYFLFHDSATGVSVFSEKMGRFYIATLILLFSINIIGILDLTVILKVKSLIINVILNSAGYLSTIVLCMYLMILRSNRQIWREFLDKRSNRTKKKVPRNPVNMTEILGELFLLS